MQASAAAFTSTAVQGTAAQPQQSPRLNIGMLIYPGMDQIDFTGPFEVLSRLPGARIFVLAKNRSPVRDIQGLLLTPDTFISEAPALDVLQIPGGPGQEALMNDRAVLSLIQRQIAADRYVFSVCTGALICGAAGILRGRRATTHWTAFNLLQYFGAIPTDSRVVVDGKLISSAGVTAGLDGALRLAATLCGVTVAQQIQLGMEYAPEPPFNSGTPKTAPGAIVNAVLSRTRELQEARLATAERFSRK
ncbi:MAG TPA: DJ-1/PfpI family protein [Bryobacteraceae bacterium]|nr:DJ-1/PfpI family protein [Bryobacteraceae bacterium]